MQTLRANPQHKRIFLDILMGYSTHIDMDDLFKLPRLYSEKSLAIQEAMSLPPAQAHYLKNVMRRGAGDEIRLFDGCNGEFLARIEALGKKDCTVLPVRHLRPQPVASGRVHLVFAPLAKARMDMVIEKTVELGVTDLHPVVTHRTEHRKVKAERLQAQIIEAAEQSERLTLPQLHPLMTLDALLGRWPGQEGYPALQWCCERDKVQRDILGYNRGADQAFLVGPVGGFDDEECDRLAAMPFVQPISLGGHILRAETASILCLSSYSLQRIACV